MKPTPYIVTLEKFGEERSRRVRLLASDAHDAMAAAQIRHRGWWAVEVVAA